MRKIVIGMYAGQAGTEAQHKGWKLKKGGV
jgi:hypothetical protein